MRTTHESTSATKTQVHTTDGVVSVSEVANNAAEKCLLPILANDIHGVSTGINNMSVRFAVY